MKWQKVSFDYWVLEAEDGEVLDSLTRTYHYHYTVRSTGKTYTTFEAAQEAAIRARGQQ